MSVVRKSEIPQPTLVDYDRRLGESAEQLQHHQKMVGATVQFFIGKGGHSNVQLGKTELEKRVVNLRQTINVVKKRPGFVNKCCAVQPVHLKCNARASFVLLAAHCRSPPPTTPARPPASTLMRQSL